MSRTGRAPSLWRRSALVGLGVALLASTPSLLAARPVDDPEPGLSAEQLRLRVGGSGEVRYTGYAEATSRLALPDVPQVGDLLELLGETSGLRVWWRDPQRWRVDQIGPTGEDDHIHVPGGSWLWNSTEQRATQVVGDPAIRLLRAADLVPPELGRRLLAMASPGEVSRIGPRRVAGHAATGLRIRPASPETTVSRADLWVHPSTGLPLDVRVYVKDGGVRDGGDQPLLETRFLDLSFGDPDDGALRFTPPPDADVDRTTAADIAAAIDQFSIFAVPDVVDTKRRRTRIASGAGTYGEGFAIVAVLTLDERNYRRARRRVSQTLAPTENGSFGQGFVITTPLINGMLVNTGSGVAYALAGTVHPDVLRRAAGSLALHDPELRVDP